MFVVDNTLLTRRTASVEKVTDVKLTSSLSCMTLHLDTTCRVLHYSSTFQFVIVLTVKDVAVVVTENDVKKMNYIS